MDGLLFLFVAGVFAGLLGAALWSRARQRGAEIDRAIEALGEARRRSLDARLDAGR
jgi:hypothetical protein